MEIFHFIIRIAVVVVLIGGVMIVACASVLRRRADDARHFSWTILIVLGWMEALIGVLAFHVGIVLLLGGIIERWFAFRDSQIVIAAMILAMMCVPFGISVIRIRRFRGQHADAEIAARFDRKLRRIYLQSCLMAVVIGASATVPFLNQLISDFFPMFVALAIGGLVGFALVVSVTRFANRRANESELLWILAIAVERNIPLPREIEMYAETMNQFGGKRKRRRLILLAEALRTGYGLAAALNKFPGLVPKSTIVAARIGEETGTLGSMLREAAIRQTSSIQRSALGPTIGGFFIYYGIVYCAALLLVTFPMIFIVPKLKSIFYDFDTELPGVTSMLIAVFDNFADYFYVWIPILMLPIIVVAAGLGIQYLGWDNFTAKWMKFVPRIETPAILRYIRQLVLSEYPLPQGFGMMAQHHLRIHVRERISRVQDDMLVGIDWAQCLQEEGLLKEHERQTLSSAQSVGNLPWALESVAANVERNLRYRFACYFEWLRPAAVLGVAAVVAFIMIGLFMPIVKLLKDLS